MSQPFMPAHLIANIPADLLIRFCREFMALSDTECLRLLHHPCEFLSGMCAQLPVATQRDFQCALRTIHGVADAEGQATLMERLSAGEFSEPLRDRLLLASTPEARACLLWLDNRLAFDRIRRLREADRQTHWRKRTLVETTAAPATDQETIARLRDAIQAFFQRLDLRGQSSLVLVEQRGAVTYWFCYPQDYATDMVHFDDQRCPTTAPIEFALPIIIRFDTAMRLLSIATDLPHVIVQDIQRLFGRLVFGVELHAAHLRCEIFHLQRLLDRSLTFHVKSSDPVSAVRLLRVDVDILGSPGLGFSLYTTNMRDPYGVFFVADAISISPDLWVVTRAVLLVTECAFGSNPPRTHHVTLRPYSCSLKHDPWSEAVRQLFIRWKLYEPPTADARAAPA
ncbi:MAG: hypothetical protein ACYDBB_09680 [Armatimonadota bacterium]